MTRVSQVPIPWPGPEFTVTFRASKWKVSLGLAVALLFVLGLGWIGLKQHDTGLILFAAFVAVCMAVFCVQLHPRASFLTLKENGFVFCSLFRSHEVLWADVQGFGVYKVSHHKMVTWNYQPAFSKHARGRNIAVAIAGCEAALPDTYGFKAEELARVMNRLKELHLSKTSRPDLFFA